MRLHDFEGNNRHRKTLVVRLGESRSVVASYQRHFEPATTRLHSADFMGPSRCNEGWEFCARCRKQVGGLTHCSPAQHEDAIHAHETCPAAGGTAEIMRIVVRCWEEMTGEVTGGAAAERPHCPLWRQEARAPGRGRPAVHTPGGALESASRRSRHSPRRSAPQQQTSGVHQAQAAPGPPRRGATTGAVEHCAHHEQSDQRARQDSASARRSAAAETHGLQQVGVPGVPES
eukprot:scaffold2126_cov68-Phaeocystis_antarctica.AAC.2